VRPLRFSDLRGADAEIPVVMRRMRRYGNAMGADQVSQDRTGRAAPRLFESTTIRALELHEARAHARGTRYAEDLGDAIMLHDPGDPDPFLNRLSGVRLPSDPAAYDRRFTELLALFASLERRPHIWLSPGFHEPADLRDRLLADGFFELGGTYAMAHEADDTASVPLPPGARLERLSTAGDRRTDVVAGAARVMMQAFDAEPGTEGPIAEDIARTGTAAWDACVIWRGDEPIAAGRRYTTGGMTYLSSIGTRPSWRGQGFGAAVTATLMQDGRRAGGDIVHLAVEWQNARAQRVYRRLGFEILGDRVSALILR